jgi:hypothetical protein
MIRGLAEACQVALTASVADPESRRVAAILSSSSLASRIGVLAMRRDRDGVRKGDIRCTATLIGSRDVLTARHCLFLPGPSNTVIGPLDPAADLLFYVAAAPESERRFRSALHDAAEKPPAVSAPSKPFVETRVPEDVVLLRLAEPVAVHAAAETVWIGEPRGLHRLTILAYRPLLAIADRERPAVNNGRWTRYLRAEARADCRVARVMPNGCVFYGCTPTGGSSGAPVIAIPDDAASTPRCNGVGCPALVAVHSGFVDNPNEQKTDCGPAGAAHEAYAGLGTQFPNVAVSLPTWLPAALTTP